MVTRLYNSGLWGTYLDSWGIVNNKTPGAQLWVLSAGHGLINGNDSVVPYDITFQESRNNVPSILNKVNYQTSPDARKKILQGWWAQLIKNSNRKPRSLKELFSNFSKKDYALVVLGKDYLDAVFQDLKEGIAASVQAENVAVICNNVNDPLVKQLQRNWLYADSCFVNLPHCNATFVNGRIAHRLLDHMFNEEGGLQWWSIDSFNDYLINLSKGLPDFVRHERVPGSDNEIKKYIKLELLQNKIPFSRLLMQYRDEGRACEYSRFKGLYEQSQYKRLKESTLSQRPTFPVHHFHRHAKARFFLPDWDDRVDPLFDFDKDAPFPNRDAYSHDTYHYELYGKLNCDGILVSKSVLENNKEKLARIKSVGIHRYLRVPINVPVLADCGAFNYISAENPPFDTEETLTFYKDLGFNYGVSIDHLIVPGILRRNIYFFFNGEQWEEIDEDKFLIMKKMKHAKLVRSKNISRQSNLFDSSRLLYKKAYIDERERTRRYDLTIRNAEEFIEKHRKGSFAFTPIGAAQGWNPESYAESVKFYQEIGYDYIALGGLARSQTKEILEILEAVQNVKKPSTELHVFGVAV